VRGDRLPATPVAMHDGDVAVVHVTPGLLAHEVFVKP
jgi:hypothetical protein